MQWYISRTLKHISVNFKYIFTFYFTQLHCCERFQLFPRVLDPGAKSSFKGKKCTAECFWVLTDTNAAFCFSSQLRLQTWRFYENLKYRFSLFWWHLSQRILLLTRGGRLCWMAAWLFLWLFVSETNGSLSGGFPGIWGRVEEQSWRWNILSKGTFLGSLYICSNLPNYNQPDKPSIHWIRTSASKCLKNSAYSGTNFKRISEVPLGVYEKTNTTMMWLWSVMMARRWRLTR